MAETLAKETMKMLKNSIHYDKTNKWEIHFNITGYLGLTMPFWFPPVWSAIQWVLLYIKPA